MLCGTPLPSIIHLQSHCQHNAGLQAVHSSSLSAAVKPLSVQPRTFQAVSEKVFPAEPIRSVRSAIPGSERMDT